MPIASGSGSMPFELSRQSSTGSLSPSPMRQASGSFPSQAPSPSHAQNNYSPIFLQWVDCVSQLLRMYPFAFEFSSAFLVDLLDCVLSCRFGNFLCNRYSLSVVKFLQLNLASQLNFITSLFSNHE
ncbi:phosphatidylinositol-3-phosphatase myotubularin-1-like [Olea europaea var. sylvestris]|uniref:phosphatidylinositol-3-phosphatase myotubularin-1-like n=1 Tax=Olea europaea var. sylvestris TaxID=158386 RepID=UPI000C1D851F|nr:phosphatidylinositol-3-phosphatase myotubularin-1-like [Olea europaea var. sylvestris]